VWRGQRGTLFATWPAPLDHDACFAEAGFRHFCDTDDAWDAEFDELLERVLTALGKCGATTAKNPSEKLARAAHDDRFEPCRIELGAPARALLCTSDGHPIVWVWLRDDSLDAWNDALGAADRPTEETSLKWDRLLPVRLDAG
jgi:hypothetical protein